MAEDHGFDLEEPARQTVKGAVLGLFQALKEIIWRTGGSSEPTPPSRSVLIIGPGGTGKTTLARLLSGQPDWLDELGGKYVESTRLERFVLNDDPDVEVVVAPGQLYRRAATWPELLGQIGAGEYRGVVVMNAYGYHTFSTPSYKDHKLFKNTKTQFLNDYFADRRADELRVLRELVPHLSICKQKVWLLSIVAKQDLWASQQGAVEQHYRNEDYAREIQTVADALGNRLFRHGTAFVSLTLRNLTTFTGELLCLTEAGYDMVQLAESLHRLVREFSALRAWEDET